jgi:hypothetical protein
MDTGVNSLISHEALPGVRVRISQNEWRPELRGMVGTVETCFGHPEYVALDVRLEDERLELFWFHQLQKVEEEAASPVVGT